MTGNPESPDERPGDAEPRRGITRKHLLNTAAVAVPASFLVGAAPAQADSDQSGKRLSPTPSCDDGDDPTPPQTEGPYFKPHSPERTTMLDGPGTRLVLTGIAFGLDCQRLPDVLLDFWMADTYGQYDNVTYRFRGHQYTAGDGSFTLTTIVPGLYPGRTRHIHVKAQAPGKPVLTTQLYFPGEPGNNTDPIFDSRLLMDVRTVGSGKEASFEFVLNVDGGPGEPGGTWRSGISYKAGDKVTYNGTQYQCQIAHTAQPGWEPPSTPALWRRV